MDYSHGVLFADDTILLAKGDMGLIDEALQKSKDWFNANKLKLNESKTKNMLFSSDRWVKRSESVRLGV